MLKDQLLSSEKLQTTSYTLQSVTDQLVDMIINFYGTKPLVRTQSESQERLAVLKSQKRKI